MRELTYAEALREGLRQAMSADERVFVMGEDIGVYGGAFGVTSGLLQEFGDMRVFDTPISEAVIAGACIGAALSGMRPAMISARPPETRGFAALMTSLPRR